MRDLGRRQPPDLAQGQRHAGLGRQGGVAAGEDEREAVVGDRAHVVLLGRQRLEPGEQLGLAGEGLLARSRSTARFRAAVMIHAPGLDGVPSRGQRSSAIVKASCTASSASWRSPRTRVSVATARPHSSLKTRPISVVNVDDRPQLDGRAKDDRDASGDRDRRVQILGLELHQPADLLLVSAKGPSVTSVSPSRTRTVLAVFGLSSS